MGKEIELKTAPADYRFPTTNQTRHCFTRYIEFHRCVAAKGDEVSDCERFAKYYRSLCPSEWVERWNEQRENGTFPGVQPLSAFTVNGFGIPLSVLPSNACTLSPFNCMLEPRPNTDFSGESPSTDSDINLAAITICSSKGMYLRNSNIIRTNKQKTPWSEWESCPIVY
ncbi:hypothetical protein DKX38_028363 [Salix brachista]|uniref:Cytochrome c oxidase subunit n=1 Tax=Salix brachista TaxID=2182728 RepID=A0A5N5JH59_9ROSI|nr:hypothetical protein DKX38_028363 [Salix brachista]